MKKLEVCFKLIFLIFFCVFFSCKKEKLHLQFESYHIAQNCSLYGLASNTSSKLFVCGGTAKQNGFVYSSSQWNGSWDKVYRNDTACIYDVFFVNDSVGYACGDRLLILKTTDGGSSWFDCFNWYKPYHPGYHVPLRKIFFSDEKTGYIVGGDQGDKGLLYKTTDGFGNWDFFEIEHELRAVCAYNNDFFAFGNGLIYQFTDNIENGSLHDFSGDFLTSAIQYGSGLFVVGYSGGIFEYNTNRKNWQPIHKPAGLFEKRKQYNKIFYNDKQLIITGNNGVVALSNNGRKWTTYYSCDGSDLINGIFYYGQILLISRHGIIYKLSL